MEECLPGVDYASIKGDPSMTHNLPATSTPSPAVEQTQAEGERSQLLCSQWTHDSHLVSCSLQASPDTTLLSSLPRPTVCPELSRAGEVTQPPPQFPQPKRKRVSSATSLGERHMKVYTSSFKDSATGLVSSPDPTGARARGRVWGRDYHSLGVVICTSLNLARTITASIL